MPSLFHGSRRARSSGGSVARIGLRRRGRFRIAVFGALVLTVVPLAAVTTSAAALGTVGMSTIGRWVEPIPTAATEASIATRCDTAAPRATRDGSSVGGDTVAPGVPVRSIGVGTVLADIPDTSSTAISITSVSDVLIRYTAGDGTRFSALYAGVHTTPGITVGAPVNAGQQVALVDSAAALLFAVHPGFAVPDSGLAACTSGTDEDGFVDAAAFLAAHAPSAGTVADGLFVSHGGQDYRIAGGAPLPVTSWKPFGGPKPVESLSDAEWAALASVPADGTVIRGVRGGEVYRLAGGAPIYVSTWTALGGRRPTLEVDDAAIDHAGQAGRWGHLRPVPSDGTLVRSSTTGALSVIASGHVAGTEAQGPATTIDQAAITNAGTGGVWDHLQMVPVWTAAAPSSAGSTGTSPSDPAAGRPIVSGPPTALVRVRLHGKAVQHGLLCLGSTRDARISSRTTTVGGCVRVTTDRPVAIRPRTSGRYFLILVGSSRHVSRDRCSLTGTMTRTIVWTFG